MNLPDANPTRKQRFEAALKIAGLTMEQWCTDHYGISRQHLNAVFGGEREASATLSAAIDETIEKYLVHTPAL